MIPAVGTIWNRCFLYDSPEYLARYSRFLQRGILEIGEVVVVIDSGYQPEGVVLVLSTLGIGFVFRDNFR